MLLCTSQHSLNFKTLNNQEKKKCLSSVTNHTLQEEHCGFVIYVSLINQLATTPQLFAEKKWPEGTFKKNETFKSFHRK